MCPFCPAEQHTIDDHAHQQLAMTLLTPTTHCTI